MRSDGTIHSKSTGTGTGLRTYSSIQWRMLRALSTLQIAKQADGETAAFFLAESKRLGVLPEAQLILKQITPADYEALVAQRNGSPPTPPHRP